MPLTPAHRHDWDLSPAAARELQAGLAGQVELADRFAAITLVAGIPCHLGWLLDVPSIGVAKSRLIGRFAKPAPQRGAWTPLSTVRR